MATILGVGTEDGVAAFAATKDGWKLKARGLVGRKVTVLALHPDGTVYAGGDPGSVYRTRDWEEWTSLHQGLEYPAVHALAFGAEPGVLFAGTSPPAIFRTLDGGKNWSRSQSFDLVPTKDSWAFPRPPYKPRVCALHRARRQELVAAVEVGPVLASPDYGQRWAERYYGLPTTVNALAMDPHQPETLYASTDSGLYGSNDTGGSWRKLMNGIPYEVTRGLALDPRDTRRIILGVHREKTKGIAVFLSADRGHSWMPSMEGLSKVKDKAISCLAAGGGVYALATTEGLLYSSQDSGRFWVPVVDPFSPIHSLLLMESSGG